MEKKPRRFTHLTETNRYKIERMLREGYTTRQIADAVHVHVSTINREKKRGACLQRDTELREREVYCADVAQRKYEENLRAKGPELKIGSNIELANFLENLIVDEKYSPDAALAEAARQGMTGELSICTGTLYSYIDKGVFSAADQPVAADQGQPERNHAQDRAALPGAQGRQYRGTARGRVGPDGIRALGDGQRAGQTGE